MMKFLLAYLLTTVLFFALFYWDASPLATVINSIQTELTCYLTSLTLNNVFMEGHRIFINSHYTLVIENACNGLVPYLFLLIFITTFNADLSSKIKWMIIGYFTILIINVLRIWLVTQMVLNDVSHFSLAHDYIGNMLLMVTVMALIVAFTNDKRFIYEESPSQNQVLA